MPGPGLLGLLGGATAYVASEYFNIGPTDVANNLSQLMRSYPAILLAEGNLEQSKYNFRYRAFPDDIGASYNGHYMVINVNVPVETNMAPRGAYGEVQNLSTPLNPPQLSTVDKLRFVRNVNGVNTISVGGQQLNVPNIANAARGAFGIPRWTRRIEESIALFMPNALTFSQYNAYEDVSLTAIGAGVGIGGLRSLTTFTQRAGVAAIGGILGVAGNVVGRAAQISGSPINPTIEVLFSTTPQREFTFEFLMAPRTESESYTIDAIVKTLRFHAAPEVTNSATILGAPISTGNVNLFYIPPAEFDISFYKDGVENTKIPRINTCVLKAIEVDYAPQGPYATFSNGFPVATRLSLVFKEVEPLHKRRILEGF